MSRKPWNAYERVMKFQSITVYASAHDCAIFVSYNAHDQLQHWTTSVRLENHFSRFLPVYVKFALRRLAEFKSSSDSRKTKTLSISVPHVRLWFTTRHDDVCGVKLVFSYLALFRHKHFEDWCLLKFHANQHSDILISSEQIFTDFI